MINILIVDDQKTLCELLKNWLNQERDFKVVGTAHNGYQALLKIEQLQPDLVLMDINMPEMDGLNATQIISGRYPQIDVISLSGDDFGYLQSLCVGAKSHLSKNATAIELAHRIRNVRANKKRLLKAHCISEESVKNNISEEDSWKGLDIASFDFERTQIINAEFENIEEQLTAKDGLSQDSLQKKESRSSTKSHQILANEDIVQDVSQTESDLKLESPNEDLVKHLEVSVAQWNQLGIDLMNRYQKIARNIEQRERENNNLLEQLRFDLQRQLQNIEIYSNSVLDRQIKLMNDNILSAKKEMYLLRNLAIAMLILMIFTLFSSFYLL